MSDSVRPQRQQPTRLPHPWDSPGKNTGVGCHFLLQCMKVKSESEVTQSCLSLSDPMDCSPPGSSVHGIFQARVLEWGCHCLLRKHILQRHNWKELETSSFFFPFPHTTIKQHILVQIYNYSKKTDYTFIFALYYSFFIQIPHIP